MALTDALLRACLRAGLTSTPRDPLGRAILELENLIRAEAEGLRAIAEAPGADSETYTPALLAAE